ncbi:MAG: hypothetical protein QF787_16660, partial [Nitrospinota bacterium]|nr:hypothetical protein [Nitrospinota bacterium]
SFRREAPPRKDNKVVFANSRALPHNSGSYYFEQEGDITHVLHTVEHDAYENQALHRDGTERNIRELENLKNILEA